MSDETRDPWDLTVRDCARIVLAREKDEDGAVLVARDILRARVEAEIIAPLVEALQEMCAQGVDDIDERLDYVVMQMDRDALKEARALLAKHRHTGEDGS